MTAHFRLNVGAALPLAVGIVIAGLGVGLATTLFDAAVHLILGFATAIGLAFLVRWLIVPAFEDVQDRTEASRGFVVALSLRIAFAVVFYWLLVAVDWRRYGIFFFDDEPYFDEVGLGLAQGWSRGDFSPLGNSPYPFVYFIAGIYYLFGYHPILVRAFNAAVGAVIAPIIYRISRELFPESRKIARVALWFSVLSPDLILWSVASVRDIQIAFGVVSVVCIAVTLQRRHLAGLQRLVVGSALVVFVFLMRPVVGWLLVGSLGMYVLFAVFLRTKHSRSVAFGAVGILLVLVIANYSLNLLGYGLLDLSSALAYIQQKYVENEVYMERYVEGRSGYLSYMFSANPLDPTSLGLGLLRGLFLPNPLWVMTVPSLYSALMFLPGVAWYILNPFWMFGALVLAREGNPKSIFVVLVTVGLFLSGTTGVAIALEPIRARVMVLPLFYVLAAHGLLSYLQPTVRSRMRVVLLGYAGLLVLLGSHYLFSFAGINLLALGGPVVVALVVVAVIRCAARALRASSRR